MAKAETEAQAVVTLPPSDNWKPEQALAAASKIPFEGVIIIGFTADDVRLVNSRMDVGCVLGLSNILRGHVLGQL